MSEKVLVIRQVVEPEKFIVQKVVNPDRDWIKLYCNDSCGPTTYEKLHREYVYHCFAAEGKVAKLLYCIVREPLDLRFPRETLEHLPQIEVETLSGEMTYEEWWLEMEIVTSWGYKED